MAVQTPQLFSQKCGNDTNDPRLLCLIWFSDCRKVGFPPPKKNVWRHLWILPNQNNDRSNLIQFWREIFEYEACIFLSILYMECYEFLNQITQTFLVQVQPWLCIFYHQWRHALFWFGSCFSLVINWKTFNFVCCHN